MSWRLSNKIDGNPAMATDHEKESERNIEADGTIPRINSDDEMHEVGMCQLRYR